MARKVILHSSGRASIYHSRVRTHSQKVFEEFAARFAIYYAWGNGPTGDHAAGKAIDLMAYDRGGFTVDSPGRIRPGWNKTVAEYAWRHRARLGVAYIIYDQLIISTNPNSSVGAYNRWVRYTGQSHANHVHISFVDNPPNYRRPPKDQEDDLPSPKDLWDHKTTNIRLTDDLKREDQGEKTMAWMVRDIEATTDLTRRQINDLASKVDGIADEVWSYEVQNADAEGPGGGMAPVRWHIKDLERTQDSQGRQLDRIEAGLRAIAAGINQDTADAVNAALSVREDGAED